MNHLSKQTLKPIRASENDAAGDTIGLILMVLVMALVMVQGLVPMSPEVYWDVDPRGGIDTAFFFGAMTLGPAVMVWVIGLSMVLVGCVLAWHVHRQRSVGWRMLVLFGVGVISALWRVTSHAGDMWRGGQWVAAGCLGLAVFYLVQDQRCRRLVVAALIAMLLPWLLNALYFVWVEHPMTVEHYRQNKMEILASRGWEFGSTTHQEYERRLSFNDVVGSVGLSNVFGSLVGAITLLAAGVSGSIWRWRKPGEVEVRRGAVVVGLFVVAGLVVLGLTHSRGAVLAFLLTVGVLGLGCWVGGCGNRFRIGLRVAIGVCVLLPIGLVVARGMMLPPVSADSDPLLSVLFRAHYWQGAWSVIKSHLWLGVGPGRFKDAYTAVKPLINPEQVSSAHNVAIDWQVMLGLGGSAWMILLLGWLWRACRLTNIEFISDRIPLQKPVPVGRDDVRWAGLLVAIVWGVCLGVKFPGLLAPEAFLVFMFGGIGALGIIAWLARLSESGARYLTDDALRLGALAAAVMLMIHAQIEMTFFHDGAMVYGWVLLALAGGLAFDIESKPGKSRPWIRWARWIPILGVGFMVMFWVVWVAIPITHQQQALRDAAQQLRRADDRGARAAVEQLTQAIAFWPTDPQPYRRLVGLRIEMADQWLQMNRRREARQIYNQAIDVLDDAVKAKLDDLALLVLRAQVQNFGVERLGDDSRRALAMAHWQDVIKRAPGNLDAYCHLAELLEKTGKYCESVDMYRRALALSETLYLDSADQLTDPRRRAIESRIDALE